MSISKKLFFVTALGLNLCTPFNASAYDVVGLKDEVQLISEFANEYDFVKFNGQTISLKKWLTNLIDSTWMTSNYKIIEVANLIKQDNDEKLLELIEKDIRKDLAIKACACSAIAVAYIFLLYEAIKFDISFPLELEILHSKIETLVRLDLMQKQINDLTQKANQTLFQKIFAKA
jgi:hypothetical protein